MNYQKFHDEVINPPKWSQEMQQYIQTVLQCNLFVCSWLQALNALRLTQLRLKLRTLCSPPMRNAPLAIP
jgi:hypothetical protein